MSATPEEEELELIRRLLAIQTGAADPAAAGSSCSTADKQAWYGDAYSFLQAHGGQHWWCRHGDVTAGRKACSQKEEFLLGLAWHRGLQHVLWSPPTSMPAR